MCKILVTLWQLSTICNDCYFISILTEKIGNRDYVLTIAKASLEDDAEYSVTAKNVSGEAKSRAQLLVEHAPEGSLTLNYNGFFICFLVP